MPIDQMLPPDPPAPPATPTAAEQTPDQPQNMARQREWLSRLTPSINLRRELLNEWSINVDYRRGKPFATDSDVDRIQVTTDWSATKAKQAQLFSCVPEVRLTHKNDTFKAAVPVFAKKLNELLVSARIGVAMDECLPDCINASGIGVAMVSYRTRTEPRTIDVPPPDVAAQLRQAGSKVEQKTIQVVITSRIDFSRVSPGDALWPVEFCGSDFNDSPWVGRSGRMSWVNAKNAFALDDADKAKFLTGDRRTLQDKLAGDMDNARTVERDLVEFHELFYWRHVFHADEIDFHAIQRLVFINNELVVDEEWQGQKRNARGRIVGPTKYPIQFLTLTYISDEAVPPSDSAMGRPQVNELNRSRSQVVRNRESSLPLRWIDTNRLDMAVQTRLLDGTWQSIIPVNGDGARAVGEVARASYPNENFEFDRIAKQDLAQTWQIEEGATAGPAIRSAAEANNRQQNFQTRIGYERARVARFFTNLAEVAAGLLQLFGDFTEDELQAMQPWDRNELNAPFLYTVRADSTLLLDAQQRIERLMSFLNMTVKSGFVAPASIIAEIAELSGLDPSVVIHEPQGKGPEPANVSLRLDAASLNDATVIAMLMHNGQFATPAELNAAKMYLATVPLQPTPPPGPAGPGGPEGAPPAGGPPAPGGPAPQPPASGRPVVAGRGPDAGTDAHPGWNTASRIEKRAEDGK